MFGFSVASRILLFTGAVDMRKGFDGLTAMVMAAGEDVYSGHLFVFVSNRRNRAKILTFQRGKHLLLCVRLERGKFKIRLTADGKYAELDATQLTMLLDGIDVAQVKRPSHWKPTR
jgi:transposase